MLEMMTLATDAASIERDWLMRLLNITSYSNMHWLLIGIVGQTAFFLRMGIQWIASERKRKSVVPTAFWWLSLLGGAMLLIYFIWRKDIVGVVGQLTGVLVYSRNLWFIHMCATASGAVPPNSA